ncbi:hypothetical protein ACEYW6_10540 [Nostoc sp. UIC 10607]
MNIYQKQLFISVQDQPAFTVKSLYQNLIQACGGKLSSDVQVYLDMEISETLYFLYLIIDIKTQEKNKNSESKLQGWGFSEDDFE